MSVDKLIVLLFRLVLGTAPILSKGEVLGSESQLELELELNVDL